MGEAWWLGIVYNWNQLGFVGNFWRVLQNGVFFLGIFDILGIWEFFILGTWMSQEVLVKG